MKNGEAEADDLAATVVDADSLFVEVNIYSGSLTSFRTSKVNWTSHGSITETLSLGQLPQQCCPVPAQTPNPATQSPLT